MVDQALFSAIFPTTYQSRAIVLLERALILFERDA
jgi:hypothetical protein